ncbi:hypothetical protein G6514_001286 [Epicoccum nigrum]|nr:hypothetical protein G6514_001286 [Epicoccum nigrum]
MSVQGSLQRPRSASWKVEAIRRGDLKISGPIPIEEDTPLNDEEEREYAEKHGEKAEALDTPTPLPHTIRQVLNSQGTVRPEDPTEEIVIKTASRDQDFARQELELHDQHPARAPLGSPLGMHPTDGMFAGQRESVFQPRSHTPPTPFRATPESTSNSTAAMNAKKQKRKSGIRGVFRKMFGRKDREESQERHVERDSQPSRRGHSYHHSTAHTVETVRSVYAKGPIVSEGESIHEGMSATLVGPDDLSPNETTPRAEGPSTPERAARAHAWETPEHPPVSAFNFGNLDPSSPREHAATLAQLEGPPLPIRSPERLSMEDRVEHLEEVVHTLDSSLRRISQHNSRQTIILESAPRNLRTRTRSTSRSVSTVSIHQREPVASSNLAYETSPPSPPLTHTDDKTGKDDLASLHKQLDIERTARLALESRVLTLQHEVSALHDLVNKLINRSTVAATSPKYPTPSPDSIYPAGEDHMPTPRQGRYEPKRQETDDSDVVSPDAWATPKEGSFEVDNRNQYF